MTNEEFLSTLKEGDFITAYYHNHGYGKLIACFDKHYPTNDSHHRVGAKFFLGYVGILKIDVAFGCRDEVTTLRKATMNEIFTLIDALRKEGYRYNRKKENSN